MKLEKSLLKFSLMLKEIVWKGKKKFRFFGTRKTLKTSKKIVQVLEMTMVEKREERNKKINI
jgi:hypothetical protein